MVKNKKLTIKQVAEIVDSEGLGYAIQHYMSHEEIDNQQLAQLWNDANVILNKISDILEPEDRIMNDSDELFDETDLIESLSYARSAMLGKRMEKYNLPHDQLEKEFNRLNSQWKDETSFLSNSGDIYSHPAFLRIIGLGDQVIPLIMKELQTDPDWWFEALEAITGVYPDYPTEICGQLDEIAKIWLTWGRQQ